LANNKGLSKVSPAISSLGVLEELSLTNCDIKLLPESISQLPNLEKLNLSVKYVAFRSIPFALFTFSRIVDLPKGFGAFSKLRVLDLSYNEYDLFSLARNS
jgi:Leucine-rich repeat (LRR) protein